MIQKTCLNLSLLHGYMCVCVVYLSSKKFIDLWKTIPIVFQIYDIWDYLQNVCKLFDWPQTQCKWSNKKKPENVEEKLKNVWKTNGKQTEQKFEEKIDFFSYIFYLRGSCSLSTQGEAGPKGCQVPLVKEYFRNEQ